MLAFLRRPGFLLAGPGQARRGTFTVTLGPGGVLDMFNCPLRPYYARLTSDLPICRYVRRQGPFVFAAVRGRDALTSGQAHCVKYSRYFLSLSGPSASIKCSGQGLHQV